MSDQQLTKARARQVLLQAREDVAALLQRSLESQEEAYRILQITGELYEGLTGEPAPEYRPRLLRDAS